MSGAPWRDQRVRGTGSPPVSHSNRTSFPTTAIRTGAGRRTKYGGSETHTVGSPRLRPRDWWIWVWLNLPCSECVQATAWYSIFMLLQLSTINFFYSSNSACFLFLKYICRQGCGSGFSIFSNCGSGSRVLMTKNWKKFTGGHFYIFFFLSKIAIYLSLSLPKGRSSYRRSLQPQ